MTTPEWDTLDLGERLRFALRKANMTGGQMAAWLGVSRTTVSEWLNNANPPKLGMLRNWAAKTGVDVEWLCAGHPATIKAYLESVPTERGLGSPYEGRRHRPV